MVNYIIMNFKMRFLKIKDFFIKSKQELKKVNWPTKKETIRYTIFVISFSLILAIFLAFFDFIFENILTRFL